MLNAALEYLDAGLPVIPVDDVTKKPLVRWKAAQSTLPALEDWEVWSLQFPRAHLGLVTGALAGVVVVEGDTEEAVRWIEAHFPYTPRRVISRRGVHFYFRHPGWHVHNSASSLYPHVDVKGDGGYVKLPPSSNYSWDLDPGADWMDLPVFAYPVGIAEPGVIDLTSAKLPEPRVPVGVSEGGRDNSLARFAGILARAGMDLQEILDGLVEVNRTYNPPVSEADLLRIANSIHGAEQRRRAAQSAQVGTASVFSTTFEVEKQEVAPIIPEAGQPRFRLRPALELMNLPPVEWLIDGRLTRGGFSCVFGAPGSGKTFLALSMGLSVATGIHFVSSPVIPGDVVYVAAEGSAGIGQRLGAWCEFNEAAPPERFFGITEVVNLLDQNEVTQFILSIRAQSEQPELVMIDTLALCIPGGDENSSLDVGLAINCVKRIQRETGAHVMLIHHSAKGDPLKERGSGSLKAAVDTMVAVQQDEATGLRTVICAKQKDAEPFDQSSWELRPTGRSCVMTLAGQALTNGIDLTGVALPGQGGDGSRAGKPLTPIQTQILTAIARHADGVTRSEIEKEVDFKRGTVHDTVIRLFNLGYLLHDEATKRYSASSLVAGALPAFDTGSTPANSGNFAGVTEIATPANSGSETYSEPNAAPSLVAGVPVNECNNTPANHSGIAGALPVPGCPPPPTTPLKGGVGRVGAPGGGDWTLENAPDIDEITESL